MAKNKPTSNRKLWVALIATAFVAVVSLALASDVKLDYQRRDDPTTIRSLIIIAVSNLSRPVPVDAKTNDYILSAQRLKFPAQYDKLGMIYNYDATAKAYAISSSEVLSRNVARTNQAQTSQDVLNTVPHLQSCQRGVQLRFNIMSNDGSTELAAQKKLSDGRTVYMYIEPECKVDIQPVLDSVKTVESY